MQVAGPVRKVNVNTLITDQFSVFNASWAKVSGLGSGNMVVTKFLDGVVQTPGPDVVIAEIGTLGEYKLTTTFPSIGFWQIEVAVAAETFFWKGSYDVNTAGALAGEVHHDRVTDLLGNGVPYVTVEVFLANTATLLYSTITAYDGSYEVPLSGALAASQLVDLRFSGGGLQTITKEDIRLV